MELNFSRRLISLIDQVENVFRHFHATPNFVHGEAEDGKYIVTFNFATPNYVGKTVTFVWDENKSVNAFFDEIRAYMFYCIDTFVNI